MYDEHIECAYCGCEIEDEDEIVEYDGEMYHVDCYNDFLMDNEILGEDQYEVVPDRKNVGKLLELYYYEEDFNGLFNFVKDYDFIQNTLKTQPVLEELGKKVPPSNIATACEALNNIYIPHKNINWYELLECSFDPSEIAIRMFGDKIGQALEVIGPVLKILIENIWGKLDLFYNGELSKGYFEVLHD